MAIMFVKTTKTSIILIILMLSLSCSGDKGMTILFNCKVYTMNPAQPKAEAVVFAGDEIIFVGDENEARRFAGKKCKMIDLDGAVVIPGLIDAHAHMMSLGKILDRINLKGFKSKAEVIQVVFAKAGETAPGEWIIGRGWDQNLWEEKQFPTYKDLSGLEEYPIFLVRVDGHAVWVNSRILAICGIDRNTPDPQGGRILRDDAGEPTGILLDNAIDTVITQIPEFSREAKKQKLIQTLTECAKYGLTGIGDAWVKLETFELYRELLDEGQLTARIYCFMGAKPDSLFEIFDKGMVINLGDGMLNARAIKLFADGALGSRGALLFEPYSDDENTCGITVTSEDEIYQSALSALQSGFQVCTHAIGDEAIHSTLNAYQRAMEEFSGSDFRLRVEHCQILLPSDIPRFAGLGIIASMQPTHATSDMGWAEDRVGADRIRGAYAWRSILDSGAIMAFGSDFPVEEVNPFLGIYSAVTRQDLKGEPEGGWYPQQRISVEEAVMGFTAGAAYAQFQEDMLGMIKPDYKADFTIIDRDIFNIDPYDIKDTIVLMTIVGGKIVYER